ncbi:MAG: hypothetical protein SGBAC_009354 [Bacillariaceae sp.]
MSLQIIKEVGDAFPETSGTHLPVKEASLPESKVKTIQQIALEVERGLPVRDHRWRLRTYKNCFVGTECVDFMVRSQLVETRSQAVELGRRLTIELNLFEHVMQEHEFKDEHLFYRFVERERRTSVLETMDFSSEMLLDLSLERLAAQLKRDLEVKKYQMHNMKVYKDSFLASDAVTYMVEEGMAKTRQDAVVLGQRLEGELHVWYDVNQKIKFQDEHIFFRFQKLMSIDESNRSVASSRTSRSQLVQVGNLLKRGLKVKNRTYRLTTYRKCFIAKHAVDYMVKEAFCASREEAVELGLSLQHELGLWHHVCDDHDFGDDYLFFRFSASYNENASDMDDSSSVASASSLSESHRTHDIADISSMLLRGINVKDRTFKLKKYKNCFVGSEAVDFLVQAKLATSRDDAVQIGRQLMDDLDFFHHVKHDHKFEDDYVFYRFSQDHTQSTESFESGISEAFSVNSSNLSDLGKDELIQIGERLRRGVRIQNRQYRFKTYRNSFIASEAVDFLVQSHIATSRSHAVYIGKQLEEEFSLFHHVSKDHQFKDEFLFFRFDTADAKHDIIARTVKKSISEFQDDVSQFMETLHIEYDSTLRREEVKQLKSVYKQIHDNVCMLLIHGPSGSGKRALVTTEFTDDPSILFASAKCEANENAPFATLRLLFSDLGKQVAGRLQIQEKLVDEVKQIHQVSLVTWIPEIVSIFPQTADIVASSNEMATFDYMCLMQALLAFCKIICEFMPIVFLLDEITSASKCSLKVLNFLLKGSQKNLLLCATQCQEVGEKHHFMEWKSEIREKVEFQHMAFANLNEQQVQNFLARPLHREPEDIESLALLLKERTNGNFFFLLQLLESLQQKNLLFYDFAKLQWTFSVEKIRKYTDVSDNVGKLLATKILQLPRSVEQTLKLASCFGTTFDPEILTATKSVLFVFDDISYTLSEACKEDLVIRISDREYKFAHSEVKDAAYKLLPNGDERKRIHWELGLKLSKKRSLITDQEVLFVCVDQLLQGENIMITTCKDDIRSNIAHLLYVAGQNAIELSAFVVASNYLKVGMRLLGKTPHDGFKNHYDSAVQLFTAYAQATLSVGLIAASRGAAEAVLLEAKRMEDKREASLALFRCFTAESRMLEQLDFATEVLESAGHKFPKDPNGLVVRREWEKAKAAIKSDENVLSLPHMTDKTIDFCYDILTDLILTSEVTGNSFGSYATARMMLMTLKYGLSKFTPLILVLVGMDFIANSNDLTAGNDAIQLGFRIQGEVDLAIKGRVLTQACMAGGCTQPISNCMYLALGGYKTSMELGDIQNAFHGARVYLWSFYFSGLPFGPLLTDIEKFARQMLEYGQHYIFHMTIPLFQMLLNLKGDSEDPCNIEVGAAYEMTKVKRNVEDTDRCWEFIRSYGMELAIYFGDFEKATGYYEVLKDLDIGFRKASILYHTRVFFFALINIEKYRRTKKMHFKSEATKHTNFLRSIVEQGGVNVNQKFQILQAELNSLSPKDNTEAIRKYEKAIVLAARTGFLQDSALGNYLCAKFCLSDPDRIDSAQRFLAEACEQYISWGATQVATSVKKRHPDYFAEGEWMVSPHPKRGGGGLRSRTHFRPSLGDMHKSLSTARRLRDASEDGESGEFDFGAFAALPL